MSKPFILLLVSFSNHIFCQTTTLKLSTVLNCQYSHSNRNISSVSIFSIPSGNLIFSKVEEKESGSGLRGEVIEIPNIPVGSYRIAFESHELDQEKQNKFITLKAIPVNYVNLCLFDKTVDEFNPFIGLKNGDSLDIKVVEVGCYEHIQYKVVFKKKGKDLLARMKQYLVNCNVYTKDGKHHVSDKPFFISNQRKVNEKQINDLVIGFSNIRLLPSNCTSHIWYEITKNTNKILLEDGSCSNYIQHFYAIFQRSPFENLKVIKRMKD